MEKVMIDNGGKEAYQKPNRGAHVLVLTYPAQGHINPMLQFSKRLASKGLKVTVITTTSISFQLSSQITNFFDLDFIRIFDGFTEGFHGGDMEAYLERLRASICQSLRELLDHYNQDTKNLDPTPKVVIYDAFMPWVLDVVRKCGLRGSPFFTQSCVVNSIYYHVYQGALKTPRNNGSLISLPSIKELLRVEDLPSFVSSPSVHPALVRIVLDQFSNFKEADCIFVNTVDKLESEVVNWMASQWSVKAIGPAVPSMYLGKHLPNDGDYGLSLFDLETDACILWLDVKESCSVVYVSMGSLTSLGEDQMEEMARGLEKCNKYFLWVVRASEENKLPTSFKEKTSEKGLFVNWCPQLKVLAHKSIGCFVTHCGWNSTLEAITMGVPMVAFPQWADQPTNAKCITEFRRIGVRVKVNEKGVANRENIEYSIQEVMEGKRAKEFKSNAIMWKQLAIQAMEEGGSSDRNIEEFVTKLLRP